MAQLLIQFQDQPIVTTASHSFLNDTNQLQLNRSARYAQQHVNQFRSIENVPSTQYDFLQLDELIYGNSGIASERFDLNTVDESIDKKIFIYSSTENQT